jgi:phytoene synthase
MASATPTLDWQHALLTRAYQGWYEDTPAPRTTASTSTALEHAYAQCEALTRTASHTFYFASALLPPTKRRAMRALYAFCRRTDDLVDLPIADSGAALTAWEQAVHRRTPATNDPILLAWEDTRLRFGIPTAYADQLIQGVGRDLLQDRYQTFDELAAYCYEVASTVGLMSMHIIGFAGETAIPYAVELGVALQLTNILRDVGEDWRCGRLYLPLDELERYGIGEDSIAASHVDSAWRAFMRFQIARTREMYRAALPGIMLLTRDGRFAVAAAAELYAAILDDIEKHDYDVFTRRAHIGTLGKLRRLPTIWYRWW